MTQTMTDQISGLRYIEQVRTTDEAEIILEAIEDDHATLTVTASVHDEAQLDALIAALQACRVDLAAARALADGKA